MIPSEVITVLLVVSGFILVLVPLWWGLIAALVFSFMGGWFNFLPSFLKTFAVVFLGVLGALSVIWLLGWIFVTILENVL